MKAYGAWAFVVLVVSVYSGACGGRAAPSPTQPTISDVGGAWHGIMTATSLVGQCASGLQYVVGGTSQFDMRLTQTGSSVAGTIELGEGTCDVVGLAGPNTLTLSTTTCRPRDRTIFFFVCDPTGSEFVLRSFTLDASINGTRAAGRYVHTDDIRMPVGGPVAGILTESGDLSMDRR